MKPFNLEEAKAGKPIITRDGTEAKFIAHVPEAEDNKVVILIDGVILTIQENGRLTNSYDTVSDIFMVSPKMLSINSYEFPEPVRKPLKMGEKYWVVTFGERDLVSFYIWYGDYTDLTFLQQGVVHRTKEAAEAHAKAINHASGGSYETI